MLPISSPDPIPCEEMRVLAAVVVLDVTGVLIKVSRPVSLADLSAHLLRT
jgi:hypothetical protein